MLPKFASSVNIDTLQAYLKNNSSVEPDMVLKREITTELNSQVDTLTKLSQQFQAAILQA